MSRCDHQANPHCQFRERPPGILPNTVPIVTHPELRTVPNALQGIPAVILLLAATILEVSGDAVVRTAIYSHVGLARVGLFFAGAALLLGYGTLLNLAPFEFGQVVGLYLATLLVVWQVINFVAFRTLPTLPIFLGGSLVIAGGAIITFWKPG
jgi:hypothetical protein